MANKCIQIFSIKPKAEEKKILSRKFQDISPLHKQKSALLSELPPIVVCFYKILFCNFYQCKGFRFPHKFYIVFAISTAVFCIFKGESSSIRFFATVIYSYNNYRFSWFFQKILFSVSSTCHSPA